MLAAATDRLRDALADMDEAVDAFAHTIEVMDRETEAKRRDKSPERK